MSLSLLFNAEDREQDGLLDTFLTEGRGLDQSFIRGDISLLLKLRPVKPSITSTRPWDDDHTTGDTYKVAIGLPDEPPTSGTFTIDYDGDSLTDVPITAAGIQAALNAAGTSHTAYGDVAVTLLSPGVFQVDWEDDGAVPQLDCTGDNDLIPESVANSIVESAGDVDSPARQIITLRQSPVAYAEPATAFTAAAIDATVTQAGSGSANKIYALTLTPDTYGGTFSVSVTDIASVTESVGIAAGTISAQDFADMLATHSGIESTANIAVSRVGDVLNVEFRGTQGLSNVPVIAVTNIDLLAPKGVSGLINLNTTNLYRKFWAETTSTSELTFTLAIRRVRATGEDAEIFQHSVTLKRNIIDVLTMTPVLFPSVGSIWASTNLAALLPTSDPGGGKPWLNGNVVNVGS